MTIKSSAEETGQGQRTWFSRFGLPLLVLIYGVAMLAPFRWNPPGWNKNRAVVSEAGVLFTGGGVVRGDLVLHKPIPASNEEMTIQMHLRADRIQYRGIPICIADLPDDGKRLLLGQDGSNVMIRVDSPTDPASDEFVMTIPAGLEPGKWVDLSIRFRTEEVLTTIAGVDRPPVKLDYPIRWNPKAKLSLTLGNSLQGNQPWVGILSRLRFTFGSETYDALDASVVEIPTRYWRTPVYQWITPPRGRTKDLLINLLGFIPLGIIFGVVWNQKRSLLMCCLVCSSISLFGEFLQLFFTRMPSASDWLANSFGGALGACAAYLMIRLTNYFRNKAVSKIESEKTPCAEV